MSSKKDHIDHGVELGMNLVATASEMMAYMVVSGSGFDQAKFAILSMLAERLEARREPFQACLEVGNDSQLEPATEEDEENALFNLKLARSLCGGTPEKGQA